MPIERALAHEWILKYCEPALREEREQALFKVLRYDYIVGNGIISKIDELYMQCGLSSIISVYRILIKHT